MNLIALAAAYKTVRTYWPIIEPVVAMVEHTAENKIPGVKKFETAIAALAPNITELQTMTPELKQAFDTGVQVWKRLQAIGASLASAVSSGAAPAAAPPPKV